jgi:hypothetical protein
MGSPRSQDVGDLSGSQLRGAVGRDRDRHLRADDQYALA